MYYKNYFVLLAYVICAFVPRSNQPAELKYWVKPTFNVNTVSGNTAFCCARSVALLR